MKKQIYLLLITLALATMGNYSMAQVKETTIQEIQSLSGAALANCNDVSTLNNTTVQFRGRWMVSGILNFPAATVNGVTFAGVNGSTAGINANGKELYVQAGSSAYSGIMIRKSTNSAEASVPNPALDPIGGYDMLNLFAGDSVEITGVLNSFQGMTQVDPIFVTRIVGANSVPNVPPLIDGQRVEGIAPVLITNLAELNGANQINNLVTGEKYEGMFVELRDLLVVNVTPNPPIDPKSTSTRVRLICEDANGNQIQVYDRFRAARLPGWGGRLNVPVVGAKYISLKGMISHSKNAPAGVSCPDIDWAIQDQGYQLHPFYPTHYQLGDSPPAISSIKVNPVAPKENESVTISADIQSVNEGVTVSGATLYYSFDTLNYASWTNLPMIAQGASYSATIPSTDFADGKLVYFYIKAVDSRAIPLTSIYPRIPVSIPGAGLGKQKPLFFVVRSNGLQIKDVQYTPFSDGRSGYTDRAVTLTGIVTATPAVAGFSVLQQENTPEWGAILVDNDASQNLNNIKLGWKITLSGTIQERQASGSSFTILVPTVSLPPIPAQQNVVITPLTLSPTVLSGNYDFYAQEKYEHMLVSIVNPDPNGKLYVVDTNADFSSNFSEFRIGTDASILPTLPSLATVAGYSRNTAIPGTRVLSGRNVSSTAFNSQRFSLITKPTLLSNGGVNSNGPDTTAMKGYLTKPIIVKPTMSFTKITGIVQHSFGNMKLLPRDNIDIVALSVPTQTALFTASDVSIYPNPAHDFITLKYNGIFDVEILSIMGSKLICKTAAETEAKIAVASLPKGMLLVKITNVKGAYVVKQLIVE